MFNYASLKRERCNERPCPQKPAKQQPIIIQQRDNDKQTGNDNPFNKIIDVVGNLAEKYFDSKINEGSRSYSPRTQKTPIEYYYYPGISATNKLSDVDPAEETKLSDVKAVLSQ